MDGIVAETLNLNGKLWQEELNKLHSPNPILRSSAIFQNPTSLRPYYLKVAGIVVTFLHLHQ